MINDEQQAQFIDRFRTKSGADTPTNPLDLPTTKEGRCQPERAKSTDGYGSTADIQGVPIDEAGVPMSVLHSR